jgi:hypothetical protein
MRDLEACPSCRRLHRVRETQCPFCFFARVVTFAALLPLAVACRSSESTTATASASGTPAPSGTPSVAVVPSIRPSTSASLTPSAIASVQRTLIGRDGGADEALLRAALDPSSPTPLASVIAPTPGMGLYGAAPPPGTGPNLGGPAVDVKATVSPSAPPDARAIAGMTPRLRYCYAQAWKLDPNVKGKLVATVALDAAGKPTVTKKENQGLPSDVEACMLASLARATFEPAPAHAIEVTVTAKPPP